MAEIRQAWRSITESLDDAIDSLDKLQDSVFNFGIAALDDMLHGIVHSDLILVGAPSGGGKTQLAVNLCRNFALQGKKVGMLALEAMEYEITMRMSYSMLMGNCGTYREFLFGDRTNRAKLIKQSFSNFPNASLIKVFYKKQSFGLAELTKEFFALEQFADVIILDHFHFLDLSGDKNEMLEQRELVSEINKLQKVIKKPIIILAQFNKSYSKSNEIFPTLADFYGTSSLTNMVTKAITITHRVPEEIAFDQTNTNKRTTLFHAPKFRLDGSVTKYFALCSFDTNKNEYQQNYMLYDAVTAKPVQPHLMPEWGKRASKSRPYQVIGSGYDSK